MNRHETILTRLWRIEHPVTGLGPLEHLGRLRRLAELDDAMRADGIEKLSHIEPVAMPNIPCVNSRIEWLRKRRFSHADRQALIRYFGPTATRMIADEGFLLVTIDVPEDARWIDSTGQACHIQERSIVVEKIRLSDALNEPT
jgi:hypothetical protein